MNGCVRHRFKSVIELLQNNYKMYLITRNKSLVTRYVRLIQEDSWSVVRSPISYRYEEAVGVPPEMSGSSLPYVEKHRPSQNKLPNLFVEIEEALSCLHRET